MALDAMHIIIGIAVVVMAVISFLDTERYMFLFPAIFFLAAVLNLVTGKYWLSRTKREKNGGGVPDGVRNDPADLYIFKRNEYLVEVMR